MSYHAISNIPLLYLVVAAVEYINIF